MVEDESENRLTTHTPNPRKEHTGYQNRWWKLTRREAKAKRETKIQGRNSKKYFRELLETRGNVPLTFVEGTEKGNTYRKNKANLPKDL